MKYQVSGSNRDTGGRTSVVIEANSKAQAEKQATATGMIVSKVEDITDGSSKTAIVQGGSGKSSSSGGLIKLIVILALVAVGYFFRAKIKRIIGM